MSNVQLLQAENISKEFQRGLQTNLAYRHLNFLLSRGEFCALVGPSGCGKTTLLRTLAGLESVTSGTLKIFDENLRNRVAMIFQKGDLFPWMTVRNNLELLLRAQKRSPENIVEIVNHWLHKLNLGEFADFYPHQVSGGMGQRVSIARAFSIEPELLLMDEPFIFLDDLLRTQLHFELEQLWLDQKPTIVFVTHDIEEAVILADRVLVMSSAPGTIVNEFYVELPRPRNRTVLRGQKEFTDLVTTVTKLVSGGSFV